MHNPFCLNLNLNLNAGSTDINGGRKSYLTSGGQHFFFHCDLHSFFESVALNIACTLYVNWPHH